MDLASDKTPHGTSPRTFALNHTRPRSSFTGCSRISDYELLGKLGEGTFGYGSNRDASSQRDLDSLTHHFTARSIALDHEEQARPLP